jgi:hypothetical protein
MSVVWLPKAIAMLALITGVPGAWLTHKNTISGAPFGAYWNEQLVAEVKAQNLKREKKLRLGLWLMLAAMVLGCIAGLAA